MSVSSRSYALRTTSSFAEMPGGEAASVFILCAGGGQRWNEHLDVPKQLIPFGGVPLLRRTISQVEARKDVGAIHCVTRDARITAEPHRTIHIAPTDSLAETIIASSPYWSGRTVILLGDVFYSDEAVALIFKTATDLAFFGRPWPSAFVRCGHGELFGASIAEQAHHRLVSIASAVIAARRETGIPGNLWNIYQAAAGVAFGSSRRNRRLLFAIDDYTNDVDTPADYARRGALYDRIASGRHRGVRAVVDRLAALPRHLLWRTRWTLAPDRRRRSAHSDDLRR